MGTEVAAVKATEVDRKIIAGDQTPRTLEAMLDAMGKYGDPNLTRISSGWHCYVDMHVALKGVEFKVASGFKHFTPSEAAEECCRRLDNALRSMGV